MNNLSIKGRLVQVNFIDGHNQTKRRSAVLSTKLGRQTFSIQFLSVLQLRAYFRQAALILINPFVTSNTTFCYSGSLLRLYGSLPAILCLLLCCFLLLFGILLHFAAKLFSGLDLVSSFDGRLLNTSATIEIVLARSPLGDGCNLLRGVAYENGQGLYHAETTANRWHLGSS
jgi:hypothetical protein